MNGYEADDRIVVDYIQHGAFGGPPGKRPSLWRRDIDPSPVAEILLPQRVPHGLHGEWMAE